jgi:transposase
MSTLTIERVDDIPIIFHCLIRMRVAERIDRFWPVHGNWKGLSYGQLAVLFITYMIHSLNHRLAGMEVWIADHHHLLEQLTGWTLTPKEATDDRLGILVGELGRDQDRWVDYQIDQGADLVQAYQLPTEIGRYDTTTVNVYHAKDTENTDGVLEFGHSKDRRPDLLQFKQSLGTLDPAGVPLLTATLKGNAADDPEYWPAWQQMMKTIGHRDFLFIGDCKGGALETRLNIAREGGCYLFPLAMLGKVPEQLAEWVRNPPMVPQDLWLESENEGERRWIGQGFEVQQMLTGKAEQGEYEWSERWLVLHSESHAQRQRAGFLKRLDTAEKAVKAAVPKGTESRAAWQARLQKMLAEQGMNDFLTVQVHEKIHRKKRYLRPGRPAPNTPYHWETSSELSCHIERQDAAIQAHQHVMGWRIYVTNAPAARLSLAQSVRYYRDEYTVERGFHRFKRGSLPVLPLFIRIPDRIKGLLFLLFIALQALTLIDFVARRELAKTNAKLSGLVPGNPKMATARPTAERLLASFKQLHLLVEHKDPVITGHLVEKLSPLQEKILTILQIPKAIYDLSFCRVCVEEDVGLAVVT